MKICLWAVWSTLWCLQKAKCSRGKVDAMRHLARCHSRSALSIVDTLSAIKCKNIEKSHNKVQQGAGKCNKVVLQCTSVYFSVLYCASLYFVVLHCTSLYFIVFHCISLHFIVFRCTLLYFTVLRCTFLCIFVHWCVHCIDLYFVSHWLSLSNIVSIWEYTQPVAWKEWRKI